MLHAELCADHRPFTEWIHLFKLIISLARPVTVDKYSRECAILTHSVYFQLSDRYYYIMSSCMKNKQCDASYILCIAQYESKCVFTLKGFYSLFFSFPPQSGTKSRSILPIQRNMDGLCPRFVKSEVEGCCFCFVFVISSISPALLAALLFQHEWSLSALPTKMY